MDPDHESTVIKLGQSLIDTPQRNQGDLGDEIAKAVEDRLGKVVVEWNVHSGRRLKLVLQVDRLRDRLGRDVGVERDDPI